MTGPAIPAELWSKNAVALLWNDEGHGRKLVRTRDEWMLLSADTLMPAGWDWRVPVMRPTVKDSLTVAPAIDLERLRVQFAEVLQGEFDLDAADPEDVRHVDGLGEALRVADRLLALIDWQAGTQDHPDTVRLNFIEGECLAVEAVSVRASEDDADVAWVISQHQMGRGLVQLHHSHDDNLRRAIDTVMQPSKGEGE